MTAMTWDEKAQRAAEALDMETLEAAEPGEVRCGFREGARWQREALLSDEAAERVADVLEALDGDDFITVARAALAAALGKGENDE